MLTSDEKQRVCDSLNLVDYIIQHQIHIHPNDPYYEDYQQEGRLGLMLAVQRYDESQGSSFSTYASSYISGYVRRFRREFVNRRVHIPRRAMDVLNKVVSLYYEGHSHQEIIETLGISEEVYSAIISVLNMTSIDQPISIDTNEDSVYLKDTLGIEDPEISDLFGEEIVFSSIEKVADELNPKHRDIWYDYIYPAYYGDKVTNRYLADKYGMSQPNINRVLNKCKNLLVKYLSE